MTDDPIVVNQEFVDWMQSKLLERASFADRTEPINEIKLIPAIKELYGLRQLTAPKVVVCQSPLQMRLMPILFLCPKLDQMFTLPNNTIREQVRANLTTSIGSDVTANLYAIFEKNYKPGDEPGEFLLEKNDSFLRQSEGTFGDDVSEVLDPQSQRLIVERYFELRPSVARYWILFTHIQNYVRQLPRNVVVPMEESLQERVVLQLGMNSKVPLTALSRHLTLAQAHSEVSSTISELNTILCERMNLQHSRQMSREVIWNALGEAHLIYPFKNICFVCQFPSKVVRRDGVLHCEDQAAIEYSDGLKLHFWRGLRVPGQLIEQPNDITASQINAERNVELRRVMIEIVGAENYIKQSGAVPIQQDEFGSLFEFGTTRFGDNITMVRLINSTAESDGSNRIYWLTVPPEVRTAKEAVAWSFNMAESEYGPIVES